MYKYCVNMFVKNLKTKLNFAVCTFFSFCFCYWNLTVISCVFILSMYLVS
uniref:Uncharacterized protein n=1 Tax=Anguilla anguilla TaxID=7936 RepID=A0A0E9X7Z3_ANGAN